MRLRINVSGQAQLECWPTHRAGNSFDICTVLSTLGGVPLIFAPLCANL